jgi:hypothetical protein
MTRCALLALVALHAAPSRWAADGAVVEDCVSLCNASSPAWEGSRASTAASSPELQYNLAWSPAACELGCGIWGIAALPLDPPMWPSGGSVDRPANFEPRLERCFHGCALRKFGRPLAWVLADYTPDMLAPATLPSPCSLGSCPALADAPATLAACRSGCALAERLSCHPGRYRSLSAGAVVSLGDAVCSDCAVGMASAAYGAETCSECDAGRFASARGSARCEECPPGTHTFGLGGAANCSVFDECPVGNYTLASGACVRCPGGSYCPHPLRATAVLCDGAMYCPEGSAAPTHVDALSEGVLLVTETYPKTLAACPIGHTCFRGAKYPCPVGRFAPVTGMRGFTGAGCVACPAGTSSTAAAGATACEQCSAGFRCVGGTAAPLGCADDGGADTTTAAGSSACALPPCGGGYYTPPGGTGACALCPAGSYCPGDNRALPCAGGAFYCPEGSAASLAIPDGYMLAPSGHAMARCTAGFRCISNSRFPCTPGTYAPATGASACERCPVGRVAAALNSTRCAPCPANTFARNTGATSCASCAAADPAKPHATVAGACMALAGAPTAAPGGGADATCAPGSFRDPAAVACSNCTSGRFAAHAGATACERCVAGRFAGAGRGASVCTVCAAGRRSTAAGATACAVCEMGKYAPTTGANACARCSAGVPNDAGTECAPDMAAAVAAQQKRCSSFEGLNLMTILAALGAGVGIPLICLVGLVLAAVVFAVVCEQRRGKHLEEVRTAANEMRRRQVEMVKTGGKRGHDSAVGGATNPMRAMMGGGGGGSGLDAQRLKMRERNVAKRESALDGREASLRLKEQSHDRVSAAHREEVASHEEELARRASEVDAKRALAAKRMERADSILQSAKARRSGRRIALAEAAWLYRADDGEVHGPFLSKKVRFWRSQTAPHVRRHGAASSEAPYEPAHRACTPDAPPRCITRANELTSAPPPPVVRCALRADATMVVPRLF